MRALTRIENMAEYGFYDLDLEESMNMHEDASELMKEIQAIESENEKLKKVLKQDGVYETIAEIKNLRTENEELKAILQLALDMHTRSYEHMVKTHGMAGSLAEKILCDKITKVLAKEAGK
jgi:hypothetical protein